MLYALLTVGIWLILVKLFWQHKHSNTMANVGKCKHRKKYSIFQCPLLHLPFTIGKIYRDKIYIKKNVYLEKGFHRSLIWEYNGIFRFFVNNLLWFFMSLISRPRLVPAHLDGDSFAGPGGYLAVDSLAHFPRLLVALLVRLFLALLPLHGFAQGFQWGRTSLLVDFLAYWYCNSLLNPLWFVHTCVVRVCDTGARDRTPHLRVAFSLPPVLAVLSVVCTAYGFCSHHILGPVAHGANNIFSVCLTSLTRPYIDCLAQPFWHSFTAAFGECTANILVHHCTLLRLQLRVLRVPHCFILGVTDNSSREPFVLLSGAVFIIQVLVVRVWKHFY